MAFRDKLKTYKTGSSLQQGSQEELQGLSNAAERPIAPSSPLESSVIGANPDQAKMAGTPNQKTSALRVAIQQEKNLGDVQRTDQARTGLTADEQATGQKGNKAQSLNSLNDRVQNLTNQMLTTAQSSTTAQMQVNPTALTSFAPESQAEAQQLLNKLGTNQATNQDILKLNQLLGRNTIDTQLSADDLKSNFMTAGQSAGQSLAGATADTVNVADIDPTTLGFQDMNELAGLLGVDPAELGTLSLKDLQDQAQKLFTDEFSKVNTLETRANDINLGPAERAEARKQLKDMGATGIRQAESDIDKLADQVANADTITFAGESLKIQDVLSDEYLSGLAAHYVDADPSDPFIKELKASEPELARWLDENATIIKQATADLDADVKTFSDMQFQNQKLKSFPDLPDLSDDVMKSILPDWGQLRAEGYNISEVPALELMQNPSIPQVTRANVRNSFDIMNQSAPQLVPQLAKLSQQQLDQLGATAGPGNSKWQSVQSYLKDVSNINSVNAAQPDTSAAFILGPGKTFADLQQTTAAAQSRARSGLFGNSPLNDEMTGVLQSNDPAQIAAYLQGKFQAPQDIANLVNETPMSASQAGQLASTYAKQTNELFDITEKYFNQDSTLDDNDITDIAKRSPANLEKVYNSQLKAKLSPAAQKQAQGTYEKYYSPEYSNTLVKAKLFSLPTTYNLAKAKVGSLKTDDVLKLDGTLNQMISQLKATNKKQNPMQHKFLEETVNDLKKQVQGHYDDWFKRSIAVISTGDDKDAVKELEKVLNSGAPGATGVARQVAKALGLNDEKMLRKAADMMGEKNVGYLKSLQSLDLAGNFLNEANKAINKWVGTDTQKKVTETVGAVGGAVGSTLGTDGCFIAGEKFLTMDGKLKEVELLTPADDLVGGGKTFATAQFICSEVYEYKGVKVAGSHAVLEDKWTRVRDSKYAVRRPDLDGSVVYVVWNSEHRMIHESGIVFSDYAETDATENRIVELKNLDELNKDVG